jgi:hypothetical protein
MSTTFLFRYGCPCGKEVCYKDKRTRDKSYELHKRFCEIASYSPHYYTNINYSVGKDQLYQGQRSVGEKELHSFVCGDSGIVPTLFQ